MIKNGMNDLLAGTKKIVNKLEDHELLDRYSVARPPEPRYRVGLALSTLPTSWPIVTARSWVHSALARLLLRSLNPVL